MCCRGGKDVVDPEMGLPLTDHQDRKAEDQDRAIRKLALVEVPKSHKEPLLPDKTVTN